MKTQYELTNEANDILAGLTERYPQLSDTKIVWNRRTRVVAGRAWIKRNRIELSYDIFVRRPQNQHGFRNTVLHEAAHIISPPYRSGSKWIKHGPPWVAAARAIGCTGDRCHQLETATKRRKHVGTCGKCQKDMDLGPVQYRRHNEWLKRVGKSPYVHTKCP